MLIAQKTNNLAAYIWSLADLLSGDFKQSQYGRIILPFTLLRRLEGVLEESKETVLSEYEKVGKWICLLMHERGCLVGQIHILQYSLHQC